MCPNTVDQSDLDFWENRREAFPSAGLERAVTTPSARLDRTLVRESLSPNSLHPEANFRSPKSSAGEPLYVQTALVLPGKGRIAPEPVGRRFELLQHWEGIVDSVGGSSFSARLADLTDETNEPEQAEFEITDVDESDRGLVTPGSVFYWMIGYDTSNVGQKLRTSLLRFRRIPALTESERRFIADKAGELERKYSGRNDPAKPESAR
jgi:hypothetical protein